MASNNDEDQYDFEYDDDLLTADELHELTEAEEQASPVSYMGTDFDVEGLVRRLGRDDIVIPSFGHDDETIEVAGFQRGFVWARNQMDRFIESLLLGYPIPGIMLVQQPNKKYLVLDGQQRLRTLAAFYKGVHAGKEFALRNVASDFRGLTYNSLEPELRRQLDNTFIQATIVRTDGTRGSREAIYQVFERLNSGGTQLTPHEIRIALYAGPLIGFIDKLNKTEAWRKIYGPTSPRLRDQELVLRIIALFTRKAEFYRPLKKYLNDFAEEHRELQGLEVTRVAQLFEATADLLLEAAGRESVRYQSRQVNAALTEALFVALMTRLERSAPTPEQVSEWITSLTQNRRFIPAITRSTASEENVRTRHKAAMRIFMSGLS